MLKNTFCHVPGISLRGEERLWAAGIRCWDTRDLRLPRRVAASFPDYIRFSIDRLEESRPRHFGGLLRANQHWRMFRSSATPSPISISKAPGSV